MISMNNFSIAVIGDEDLVNNLRLAGVTKYYVIPNNKPPLEDVRKILYDLINEPGMGIIAIQEEYTSYVKDMIIEVKESKMLTPLVIEVPSKFGTLYENVSEYYKSYVREFTGFNVEI